MPRPELHLDALDVPLAVARLQAGAPAPAWAGGGPITALLRAPGETTVVCPAADVPEGVLHEGPFRALIVRGPLDFSLTGILASLTAALAQARIPVFALSTFDTDVLLVGAADLDRAISALRDAGHGVAREAAR